MSPAEEKERQEAREKPARFAREVNLTQSFVSCAKKIAGSKWGATSI